MHSIKYILIGLLIIQITFSQTNTLGNNKAEILFQETFKAHGGDLYNTAQYAFVFRKKTYTVKNNNALYEYTVTSSKKGTEIKDVLNNNGFFRYKNGVEVNLSEKKRNTYQSALNSVIYFATLPHKLNDKAVNKSHQGTVTINGTKYDLLGITFNQEGGGEDFDDTFLYWINSNTKKIDFLAYNYTVNGGGVRFRSAYNTRIVDGIIFQDFVNFKAKVGTPLKSLSALYERNALKELSRIKTENVLNLN